MMKLDYEARVLRDKGIGTTRKAAVSFFNQIEFAEHPYEVGVEFGGFFGASATMADAVDRAVVSFAITENERIACIRRHNRVGHDHGAGHANVLEVPNGPDQCRTSFHGTEHHILRRIELLGHDTVAHGFRAGPETLSQEFSVWLAIIRERGRER